MYEISIKIECKNARLSNEEIASKLEAQRAAIPDDVKRSIDEFLIVTNVTTVRRLLRVIDAFPDPEEGFNLWKTYYTTGNDSALKDALTKQRLLYSIVRAELREAMRNEERLGEAKPGLMRSIKKEIRMLFGRVAMGILAPKVNHIDTNKESAIEIFQGTRRQVYNPNQDASLLNDVLHSELKTVFDEKLMASLDVLKAVVDHELLPREIVLAARDQIIEKRLALFDRLASQSFGPTTTSPVREATELLCLQIPKGQKFGIECEGFLPSDETMMKQSMEIWSTLKQYKMVGLAVRFPLMSLVPKNDDKYDKWSITLDTSVINPLRFVVQKGKSLGKEKLENMGLEIVSPILEGPMGGLQAYLVTETLKAMGFKSNQTCGFHVHVDISDAPLEELKNLAKAFAKNEARIDSFVDPQRRGEQAVFAKSVAAVNPAAIDTAKDVRELIDVMNQGDRNSKFDITNLGVPGAPPTVQYRGEGGAGYIDNDVIGYAVLMVNFTHMARTNPNLTIDAVLTKLRSEKTQTPTTPTPKTPVPQFPEANS